MVIAQFQLCWPEFLQYVTDRLGADNAVRSLYTKESVEVTHKSQLVDGDHYYTHTQEELSKVDSMTGLNRKKQHKVSPMKKPLISPEAHKSLIKSAEKRMQRPYPMKILVRANRWTEHVMPPSRHCKEILCKGTFTNFTDEITHALNLTQCIQCVWGPNGNQITSLDQLKHGMTVYLCRKGAGFTDRDWGKTLCPTKAKTVVVHANHWSNAPPPSRYTQNVVVPSNFHLLCEVVTHKLKTDQPVLRLFQKSGKEITDVSQIKDNTSIYLMQPPDKLSLSKREWGATLNPPKKKVIHVHENWWEGDLGKIAVLGKNMVHPDVDPEEQWLLLMEECTRVMGASLMYRKLWNSDGDLLEGYIDNIEEGGHYFVVPPPKPKDEELSF